MLIAIRLFQGIYQTNLKITVGESVSMAITILEADGVSPIILTGYGMKAMIRTSCYLPGILLDTDNGGIIISDSDAGQAQMLIKADVTAGISPGEYPYDFWLIAPDGFELPLLQGMFTVQQNVTSVPIT